MQKFPSEPSPLPMKRVTGIPKEEVYIKLQAAKLLNTINKLTTQHSLNEVIRVLGGVWQDGYNQGLQDMDAMHITIEK